MTGAQLTSRLKGRIRPAAAVVATVVLVGQTVVHGFTSGRQAIFQVLFLVLLLMSLGNVQRFKAGMVRDWLPFYLVVFTYGKLRGRADSLIPTHHIQFQVNFDQALFGGNLPSFWLQTRLYDAGHVRWYDYAAWGVYMSHFFVSFVVAAILWKVAYERFRTFIAVWTTLTFAAFATYVLFPAEPPWMAGQHGYTPPLARVVHDLWLQLGANHVASLFAGHPSVDPNQVAAVPSLHAAYPMLLVLMFWKRGALTRLATIAYTLALGLALVYGAEHYVFDVVLGWAYAGGAWFAVTQRHAITRAVRQAASAGRRTSPAPASSRVAGA